MTEALSPVLLTGSVLDSTRIAAIGAVVSRCAQLISCVPALTLHKILSTPYAPLIHMHALYTYLHRALTPHTRPLHVALGSALLFPHIHMSHTISTALPT